MKVMVDMVGYEKAYGEISEQSRRLDYSHDWEEWEITPEQLKEFIDKGIDIKFIFKYHERT